MRRQARSGISTGGSGSSVAKLLDEQPPCSGDYRLNAVAKILALVPETPSPMMAHVKAHVSYA
jgi:hypothetical protein